MARPGGFDKDFGYLMPFLERVATAASELPDASAREELLRLMAEGLALAERIRDAVPSVRIESNCGSGSFKSQLKRADKSGAHLALILGDGETERRVVGLKSLRAEAPQVEIAWDRVADEIAARLGR